MLDASASRNVLVLENLLLIFYYNIFDCLYYFFQNEDINYRLMIVTDERHMQ